MCVHKAPVDVERSLENLSVDDCPTMRYHSLFLSVELFVKKSLRDFICS